MHTPLARNPAVQSSLPVIRVRAGFAAGPSRPRGARNCSLPRQHQFPPASDLTGLPPGPPRAAFPLFRGRVQMARAKAVSGVPQEACGAGQGQVRRARNMIGGRSCLTRRPGLPKRAPRHAGGPWRLPCILGGCGPAAAARPRPATWAPRSRGYPAAVPGRPCHLCTADPLAGQAPGHDRFLILIDPPRHIPGRHPTWIASQTGRSAQGDGPAAGQRQPAQRAVRVLRVRLAMITPSPAARCAPGSARASPAPVPRQRRCLAADIRDDQLIQVAGHDLAHQAGRPATARLADVRADLPHPVMTGPRPAEKQPRDRAADGVTPADQAIPVKRRSVGWCARLGDDRLIKVKERGGRPAPGLGGTGHGQRAYDGKQVSVVCVA